jgi:hypothetical protein
MNLQFYISDIFSNFYLPFLLYRESFLGLINKNFTFIKIEYIYDFKNLNNEKNTIIITNIYSINEKLLHVLNTYESKIILINTEHYYNLNVHKIIDFINNKLNFYILEYNILNINYYKSNKKNINYFFVPLCYNKYIENYYYNQVTKKDVKDKDIDIFFFGSINERRSTILNSLEKKYKVVIMSGKSDEFYNKIICNLIESSKIVLNILYYENDKIFDYYRNSLVLITKTLLIYEKSVNKNYEIEDGLLNVENNTINVDYTDIINTVDKYMSISEDEYNNIVDKQYEAFKKYEMENKVVDFFGKIL